MKKILQAFPVFLILFGISSSFYSCKNKIDGPTPIELEIDSLAKFKSDSLSNQAKSKAEQARSLADSLYKL
ncbi:MAG: hypothetical protein ACJAZ3_002026 [Sphingobacteriales bacterium]|jgi:hypothetical protein